MKTLSYSKVKYTPRVPLILLTVEKIAREDFYLVLSFFLSFLLLFPYTYTCNSKVYDLYEQSSHQTTALLSEMILFLIRAACELRLASYGSKRMSQTLFYVRHFVRTYMCNSKTKDRIRMLYLTNNCSTVRDIYFLGLNCMQDTTGELWIQTRIATSFQSDILCILTLI